MLKVKSLLIELEDGTLMYRESPLLNLAGPAPEPVAEKPAKRRRGRPRKVKAEPVAELVSEAVVEPVVEAEPVAVAEPVAEAVVEPAKRRGGRRKKAEAQPEASAAPVAECEEKTDKRNERMVFIPLEECKGVAYYRKKDGGSMLVAIRSSGTKKNGTPWYRLMFTSKNEQWAFFENAYGFFGSPAKMSGITYFE